MRNPSPAPNPVRRSAWTRCRTIAVVLAGACWCIVAGEVGYKAVEKNMPAGGNEPEAPPSLRVAVTGQNAFSYPAPVLDRIERRAFSVGNSFFKDNWVPAPASTTGRDGLGPKFNARSCSACHLRDGRAAPPLGAFEGMPGLVFMLPNAASQHARFGPQLQDRAIPGFEPEATVSITTQAVHGTFDDGEAYTLERFHFVAAVSGAADAELDPPLELSPHIAPAIVGMGLLESIPEATVRDWADPDDQDGDGISGRAQDVVVDGKTTLGRFGWKAGHASVERQVAQAFQQDMGITNPLFPAEATTNAVAVSGGIVGRDGGVEIDAHKLQRVTFYTQHLAVPEGAEPTPSSLRGRELVTGDLACTTCHKSEVRLGGADIAVHPAYAGRTIAPYTDLLLHDMGEELGDAAGSEWRTPPLWGIGRVEEVNGHTRFLHDGRARNLTEAILWHGGEAAASRDAFKALDRQARADVVAFLKTL